MPKKDGTPTASELNNQNDEETPMEDEKAVAVRPSAEL